MNLAKPIQTLPLLCLLFLPGTAIGASTAAYLGVRPLYSFNQSPLVQIYGLPALGEARVLGRDESSLALHWQIANNFTGAENRTESLNLDGETHRLSLAWRQGWGQATEWGIELPYLTHNGGFLDSAIDHWHETFGLPNGGRNAASRNQINYRYTRNGVDLIRVDHSVSGVGDLRLSAAKQLATPESSGDRLVALRASLKLPTGDDAELLGSGSTDLALWLSASSTRPPDTWNVYGGGGLLLMSKGDVLPSQQRSQVGFGTLGFSRTFLSSLAFNAQLDAHSAFYGDTEFRQMSAYALQGLLGLRWELLPRRYMEFSISEDLAVDTSPDVVFNLSLFFDF
ncbi:MAG TPA: DUF3187 family protein [Candidatus Methylomirabilis sp.]|nr:DUF3187 family protein [Candidatus Methylomirabilis sp.]